MLYCPDCKTAFGPAPCCPVCGNEKIRAARPDDVCYLGEFAPIQAGILKDMLDQSGIPALGASTIGAGMAVRTGPMFEKIELYVRCEHLARAGEIKEALLAPADAADEA